MSRQEASELAMREKEWQAKFDVAYDLLTVSDCTQCRLLKVPSRDYYAKKLGQALLENDHITDLQLNSTRWSSVGAIKDIERFLQSTTSLKKFHLRDSYSNPMTARLLSFAAGNKHIKEIRVTCGNPARNPSAVLDLLKAVPENALTSLCLMSLTAVLPVDADEEAKANVDDNATKIAKSIRAQKNLRSLTLVKPLPPLLDGLFGGLAAAAAAAAAADSNQTSPLQEIHLDGMLQGIDVNSFADFLASEASQNVTHLIFENFTIGENADFTTKLVRSICDNSSISSLSFKDCATNQTTNFMDLLYGNTHIKAISVEDTNPERFGIIDDVLGWIPMMPSISKFHMKISAKNLHVLYGIKAVIRRIASTGLKDISMGFIYDRAHDAEYIELGYTKDLFELVDFLESNETFEKISMVITGFDAVISHRDLTRLPFRGARNKLARLLREEGSTLPKVMGAIADWCEKGQQQQQEKAITRHEMENRLVTLVFLSLRDQPSFLSPYSQAIMSHVKNDEKMSCARKRTCRKRKHRS